MIKIETEKDGKINAAICGAPDEVLPEFFFTLASHRKNLYAQLQGWTTRRVCGSLEV